MTKDSKGERGMSKLFYLTFIILFSSCYQPQNDKKNYVVSKKYCVEVCIKNNFRSFHNEGKSWGTGSSSMNGLSESQIFVKVEKHCVDFYEDSNCCEWNYRYADEINISWIHDKNYGPCLTPPQGVM